MSGKQANVLILDDDADVALAARMLLRRHVAQVATLDHPAQLPAWLASHRPHVVLLDLNFSAGRTDGGEGMQVVAQLRSLPNPPEIIAMTAYADVPLAVAAMQGGVGDFLTKPWNNVRLVHAVEGAFARWALRSPVHADASDAAPANADGLLGSSTAMAALRDMIASVGPTEANVMILGENGVGKELVARAVHRASCRAARQFLAVDMGSLPEATLESELFGHRRGAFTDARTDRAGRFQAACGGTLFLDEISNMPLAAQAKLLTVLERRQVTPLGADKPEGIDVRVVSATNLDEERLNDVAIFRTDLLFRLNTIVLRVPPLRERPGDIPDLLRHYLFHYEQQYRKPARAIAATAFDALCADAWPGNVRSLRHACERAVILGRDTVYALADFGIAAKATAPVSLPPLAIGVPRELGTLEREAIAAALLEVKGNISKAARTLGVSRAALYRKLDKHGL
jgi:DNA-binding NtrC family response regulator